MKNSSTRALRRHHYARLKAKRVRVHYYGRSPEEWTEVHLGIAADTPCMCSCHMCCNARSTEGVTLAEKRSRDSMKAKMSDYGLG